MVRTTDELIKSIEAVTSDDLLGIANDIFDENKLSTLIFNSK
jgi:predicted Zn-dependent peptidase